jgi:hypothetical protein
MEYIFSTDLRHGTNLSLIFSIITLIITLRVQVNRGIKKRNISFKGAFIIYQVGGLWGF